MFVYMEFVFALIRFHNQVSLIILTVLFIVTSNMSNTLGSGLRFSPAQLCKKKLKNTFSKVVKRALIIMGPFLT